MSKERRAGLISNVVNAVDNLVSAAISAERNDDSDDMGTYYEEQALSKALDEFVDMVIDEGKEKKDE
jgi:hypothetical protein